MLCAPDELLTIHHKPQSLTLFQCSCFSVRLNLVTEALGSATLKAVRAIPSRYAELNPKRPYIAKIEVKALNQGGEE